MDEHDFHEDGLVRDEAEDAAVDELVFWSAAGGVVQYVAGGELDGFCEVAGVQVDLVFVEGAEVYAHFQKADLK